jgi:acetyltransferase
VSKKGLLLAELSPETTAKLQKILPPAASSHNPVDVLGDAPMQRYEVALTLIANDPAVEMLLIIVTPQSMTEATATAEAVLRFREHSTLPMAAVFAGKDSFAEARALLDPTVATYQMPEAAADALTSLYTFSLWAKAQEEAVLPSVADTNTTVTGIIERAVSEKKTQLLAIEVESVLANYGFTFPRAVMVTSRADAEENTRLFSAPVVLKIISPDIIHKSDAGGVLLNIPPENIGSAYDTLMETITKNLPEANIKGVSINEQIDSTHGKELILGIKTEPGLGKVIVVGLGGIYVEVFQDASLRFAPLTRTDVAEMLDELKSKALLAGTRGEPPIDLEPIYEAILRLSNLATNHPEIESLDVNPFLVFPKGKRPLALDARISLL